MLNYSRPWWAKWAASLIAVAIALLISLVLAQFTSYGRLFFFMGAVIVSALYGGFISGLVATVLSLFAIQYFLLDTSFSRLFNVSDTVVFTVFAVIGLGISWLEDRRQTNRISFRASEKRFELVTQALYGLIFDYDLITGKVYRSKGLLDIIGLDPANIVDTIDWWQAQVMPEDLAKSNAAFAAATAIQSPVFQFEYRIRHKDGHYVWVWDNSRILYNKEGRPIRVVGCTLNINDRVQTADRVIRLQSLTEALSESVTLAQVAQVLTEQSLTAVGAISAVVNLFHADTDELEIVYSIGFHESLVQRYQRATMFAPGASPEAAQTRQPVWFHSKAEYLDRFPTLIDVPQKQNSEAIAGLPLIYQGRLLGVLGLYFAETRAFHAEEKEFLLTIARQCAIALERAQLYETAQQQRRIAEQAVTWLTRLQFVTASLSQAFTSQEVARIIVDSGIAVLGAVNGAINLKKDERNFEVVYAAGIDSPQEEAKRWQRFLTDPTLPAVEALQSGQALWLESADERNRLYPALIPLSAAFPGAWAFLPLHIRDRVIGAAGFIFPHNRPFSAEEKDFMLTLAHYCTQAMERTRLYETTRQMGAAEERQRLARELHDAVTQTLFSASLMADTVAPLIDQNAEQAKERVVQLVQLNRAALAEMRTLLLELRPEQVLRTSIHDLLTQLAQAIQGRKTIELSLSIEGVHPLPPDVHVAFYRITQEVLNNVVKHSKANEGIIFLNSAPDGVELHIRDNGIGFDPQSPKAGLGLATMRERAEAVGASIEYVSQPGQGTEIIVIWKPTNQTINPDEF
jgi:PAS domain S-box-containing protein